jgi:hypothetical protein
MKPVTYPVFTVIVFAGSPSADALAESYRRTFESEAHAIRYAGRTVRAARMNFAEGRAFTPPCASVFEDSPTLGLGRHVAERASSARRKYLASIAVGDAS